MISRYETATARFAGVLDNGGVFGNLLRFCPQAARDGYA